jgi:hypothetical protein
MQKTQKYTHIYGGKRFIFHLKDNTSFLRKIGELRSFDIKYGYREQRKKERKRVLA